MQLTGYIASVVDIEVQFENKQESMYEAVAIVTPLAITSLAITSLAKEVMFLVALVCMFVCLFVDNITHKVMNGLG